MGGIDVLRRYLDEAEEHFQVVAVGASRPGAAAALNADVFRETVERGCDGRRFREVRGC
jgi:hypothetical protein